MKINHYIPFPKLNYLFNRPKGQKILKHYERRVRAAVAEIFPPIKESKYNECFVWRIDSIVWNQSYRLYLELNINTQTLIDNGEYDWAELFSKSSKVSINSELKYYFNFSCVSKQLPDAIQYQASAYITYPVPEDDIILLKQMGVIKPRVNNHSYTTNDYEVSCNL